MARRRYGTTIRIAELNISGEEVKIDFNTAANNFSAEFNGEEFADANYNALVYRIKKRAKEYKPLVFIPVTKVEHNGINGNEYTDCTVTGIHARTRNILARIDATNEVIQIGQGEFANREKDRTYGNWDLDRVPRYVRRLTDAERRELNELTIHEAKAERARDTLQRAFRIPIVAMIEREQRRTADAVTDAVERDALETDPRVKPTQKKKRSK